jgi:hypothetical protein
MAVIAFLSFGGVSTERESVPFMSILTGHSAKSVKQSRPN